VVISTVLTARPDAAVVEVGNAHLTLVGRGQAYVATTAAGYADR
jgi:hypothetical protein